MNFVLRVGIVALFLMALFISSTQAAQRDAALQSLLSNSKLLDAQDLLAPFEEGEELVNIIVGIEPSLQARNLAEESKNGNNGAQAMFVSGGPIFYDMRNESIKSRLQETVRQTVADFVGTLDFENVTVDRTFNYIFGFSGSATPEGLQQLADNPSVKSIEKDLVLVPHLNQGIPLINASGPRSSYDGSGLSIAICDTGIDTSHPRLGNGGSPFNSKVLGGYDHGMGDSDPRPSGTSPNAHGTACAGIAAGDLGTVGDYIGGVAPGAKLYSLKISNDTNHSASSAAMASAWDWVVDHQNDDPSNPIMIISTSFGGGRYTSSCDSAYSPMTTAAANAVAAGITIFASSGNDGFCDSMGWPACISYVNSVGAVYDANIGTPGWCVSSDSCAPKSVNGGCYTGWAAFETSTAADQVTLYSNTASFLTMFSSSNNAYTTDIAGANGYSAGDYSTAFGGTSAACPYAAGAAAVLQSASQSINGTYLNPSEVNSLLVANGDDITDGKVAISKPRINLANAVAALGDVPDSDLERFLSYKAKTTKQTPQFESTTGSLSDLFEDKNFDIKKMESLLNPAASNFDHVKDKDSHLIGYKITQVRGQAKYEKQSGMLVTNELGTLVVETKKLAGLLVPSSQGLDGPVEPLDPLNLDHFKCYKVKVEKKVCEDDPSVKCKTDGDCGTGSCSMGFPKGVQRAYVDEFDQAKLFDIKKPTRLCVPVDADGGGIIDEETSLMCYQAQKTKKQPKHIKVQEIYVNNQFAVDQLEPGENWMVDTIKEEEVCIPSLLGPVDG